MNKFVRPSNSKKREDRTAQQHSVFDALNIESKSIDTALLLLRDTDNMVIAQALAALDRFAIKFPENLNKLISLDILTPLLPLIEHPEIYVRRFATKLLAELSAVDETKKLLMTEPSGIPFLCDILIKEVDVPLQEFASEILAELTKMHAACAVVLESAVVDILFQRVKSDDPDVKHNSAKIMLNLLRDPDAASVFLKSPSFDFGSLLRLLKSEYPLIQMVAIDVLDLLTKQRENKALLEKFCSARGMEELIDILEMLDWTDLHSGILTILKNVADNPSVVQHISTSNFLPRLVQFMNDIQDAILIESTLDIFANIATLDLGRKILMENNITEILIRYVRDENPSVTRAASIGMGNIMQNQQALEIFSKDNPLREVMSIIRNDMFPWETRHGAMLAVCNMIEKQKSICELFVNLHQQDVMFHLLKQSQGKAPVSMLITVLRCLAICAASEDNRMKMLHSNVVDPILPHLESPDAQLRVAACFALSAYACEPQVREQFIFGNGPSKLMTCLKSPQMPVRQAAASLLQLLALDVKITEAFIGIAVLDWMMEQIETQNVCPSWVTAIETLFSSCLPAKFFYLGRVDMQDVTGEVFYVLKEPHKNFIVLDEILAVNATPVSIMYVANFTRPLQSPSTDKARKGKGQDGGKRFSRKSIAMSTKTKEDIDSGLGGILYDQYLIEYVEQLRKLLKTAQEKCVRFTIPQKAAVLATFVASKMCGLSKGRTCTNHLCNLHITELKTELSSGIIPLGYIRVGVHFERAVLFKVLADKVGIPCALVRGEYGRTWNEIAFPQTDALEENQSLHVEDLPKRLLKPNYIVDLMDEPGKLLKIGSFEAARYCALPSSLI